MNVLTLENTLFNLNSMPDVLEDDIRFSILDNSNPKDPDFLFVPLIYLETFTSPAIVLSVGGFEVTLPLDWNIVVGDNESNNDLEIIPLTSINDRGFSTLVFNPLTSPLLSFAPIKITNFYNEVKWYTPKVRNNQLIGLPVINSKNPVCIYITREISKQCECIDYSKLM